MIKPPQSPAALQRPPTSAGLRAFTLVELLTAMTVLLVMILVMVQMTNQTNKIWRGARARISAFQQARNAFERVTSNLGQATLNTYFDYYDANQQSRADLLRKTLNGNPADPAEAFVLAAAKFHPTSYDRTSDLQFVCGPSQDTTTDGRLPLIKPTTASTRPTQSVFFQCPIGYVADPNPSPNVPAGTNAFKNLTRALNSVGYYVEFANGNDAKLAKVPKFIPNPPAVWRYRLMELNQPSQYLNIYAKTVQYANPDAWYSLSVDPATLPGPTFAVADNIIALVIRPKVANPVPGTVDPTEVAPNYAYDTKYYFTSSSTSTLARLSKNQLPPLVQVTLVAIDADSATRLAAQYGSTPPPLVDSMLFTDTTKYDADVTALESSLRNRRLTFRTFVTDVTIPDAKWSETR